MHLRAVPQCRIHADVMCLSCGLSCWMSPVFSIFAFVYTLYFHLLFLIKCPSFAADVLRVLILNYFHLCFDGWYDVDVVFRSHMFAFSVGVEFVICDFANIGAL